MSRPLRILHTESSLGWGGQENRTINEMIAMRDRGHTLAVLSRPGARILERAGEKGFDTFAVDMRGVLDLPNILRLRSAIQSFAPDVVNTHSGRDTQLAGLAARTLPGRPRIVRTRHLAMPITSKFTYSVLPDHVVTVSRFVENNLVLSGVPKQMVTTVHTGIDLSDYQNSELGDGPSLRDELGLPASSVLIGTIAILRKKKGHAELLEAVPQVLARHPEARFVFAGDGPQTENLQRRIIEMGLQDRVFMLGLRRDVKKILKSLDIFVLPTHQEALGTAFIEASAMGLPVVGARVDGVPEVIAEGETGFLVEPKSPMSIAASLLKLLENSELRHFMGVEGQKRVSTAFSCETMAAQMEALYLRLLRDPFKA